MRVYRGLKYCYAQTLLVYKFFFSLCIFFVFHYIETLKYFSLAQFKKYLSNFFPSHSHKSSHL